jgi:hypothetical protein
MSSTLGVRMFIKHVHIKSESLFCFERLRTEVWQGYGAAGCIKGREFVEKLNDNKL